jgi:pimeloyl-[acyl-carrier protein] methyl ester esterase
LLAGADTRGLLPGIAVPVLVLSAVQDRVISKDTVDAMAALVPKAHRVHLDGAGHAPYIEQVDAYNGVLSRFLA